MADTIRKELTKKQEKLLVGFDLNEYQRAKVREIWETETKIGVLNWLLFGGYLVSLFIIFGLASQLIQPNEKIANLAIFFTWIYYPGISLFLTFSLLMLFVFMFVYNAAKIKPEDQRPPNFTEMEKVHFRSNLNQSMMKIWAGKKSLARFFSLISNAAIIVLLVSNGYFVSGFMIVAYLILVHVLLYGLLKVRTQETLDQLAKDNRSYATGPDGQIIEVDILTK